MRKRDSWGGIKALPTKDDIGDGTQVIEGYVDIHSGSWISTDAI